MFVPTDDGRWVSEDYERLASVIKDYDEGLELRWIPYENRTKEDTKPYMVVETKTNSVVFYASELDSPTEILAKLFAGDDKHGNVLQRIEAFEAAQEIMKAKEWMDRQEQAEDEAKFMLGTKLHTFNMNGKKFDGQTLKVI